MVVRVYVLFGNTYGFSEHRHALNAEIGNKTFSVSIE